nr:hypothetical protein [Streptomyces albus]
MPVLGPARHARADDPGPGTGTGTGTRTGPDPGSGGSGAAPGERIADGLRRSPVYVDPSYESAFPPARQRELVAKIKASGLPVRVVVVPFVAGDAWGGDPDKMVDVVRDRLGESTHREAVYMTLSRTEGYLNGYEFPDDDKHQAFWGVAAVGHQEDMRDASLYAKFSRALEIVKAGDGDKVYEEATKDLSDSTDAAGAGSGGSGGTSPLLYAALGVAALAVLAAAALAYRTVRRRSGASARSPFTSPRSVFASARTARFRDLRRRAQRELLAYNEELLAHEPDGHGADSDRLQLSLDAYDAAGRVLDAARGVPDLAGVLALLHEGRGALRRGEELPLCFFHPLHGPAAGRVRWRPLGRRESLDVAACGGCRSAVSAHRAPEVLTQRHEGRDLPYFEVPPEHSLWAETGYGSLTEGTLTERVLGGGFSARAARAGGAAPAEG